ncbi:mannitol dehydrogenase family protein [Conservatibacter flavescens]|uniref:Mannitol dehydrogenase family protein n=1 Tax=Conservatibacter flavescens TaxID=28161 RepID=A0A2M8S239_9PAST|nr:mannitol dehydrogenase family protein [Conservatibacter flavescens]PJG85213.1 mannitol dehydrogenase family protein [Conservatibacter flavescens]
MKLNYASLQDCEKWQGYSLPNYDVVQVAQQTKQAPIWLHLGAGNIFRAFLANLQQQLLNQSLTDKGIIVAEGFDEEIIEKAYRPFDNLSIFARLKNDHTIDKIIIGSISESLKMDCKFAEDFNRLQEIFCSPSLQMVSLTITEKGYLIKNQQGEYTAAVQTDFSQGLNKPQSYIGKIVALLHSRFINGAYPLALVSMDNMSKNGEKLQRVILEFAQEWKKCGVISQDFIDYLNSNKISFPWSMIDKITPRPDSYVQQQLQADGIENLEPVITSKNTYVAPFVNAEELEYLAIEDDFPNGRPPLDKVGVIFTSREIVNQIETMKVTTCLNPLHTGLAIFGCLLGYNSIAAEMQDPELLALVNRIGYQEGLPVVIDPKIINPKQFIDEVVNIRLPNAFIPDTPQRIATDTSQKLSIRFGETIRSYLRNNKDLGELVAIPLVFAGWLRYLLGVDDEGNLFELSPDPLLSELKAKLSCVKLGENVSTDSLKPILSDKNIFGVDLYDVGLAQQVELYFNEMLIGKGSVRASLQKYLN